MVDLDARKREILRVIIDNYILSAEPVGSEVISGRHRLGVSSATVRNEMAVLEDMGYLRQPHTSAGRVPTEQAYRVYVDSMITEEQLPPAERSQIRRTLFSSEPEQTIQHAARTLASLTNFAAVVAPLAASEQRIRHLHLIPLSSARALVVVVTDDGVFEGQIAEFSEPLGADVLDRLSQAITRRIAGRPIRDLIDGRLDAAIGDAALFQRVVTEVERLVRDGRLHASTRVYTDGKANILKQPEFQDVRRAQPVLSALEREDVVVEIVRPGAQGERVRITIGRENVRQEMRECSVITASYYKDDRPAGVIGIVGPTRMRYSKVVSLVSFLADSLGEALGQ
jgi:heat-inducible transcriptional repressor